MSQKDKLLELLEDGKPHSTIDIRRVVYGSESLTVARIAARIADLKAEGHEIEGKPGLKNKQIWWYRLVKPGTAPAEKKAEPDAVAPKKEEYRIEFRDGRPVAVLVI